MKKKVLFSLLFVMLTINIIANAKAITYNIFSLRYDSVEGSDYSYSYSDYYPQDYQDNYIRDCQLPFNLPEDTIFENEYDNYQNLTNYKNENSIDWGTKYNQNLSMFSLNNQSAFDIIDFNNHKNIISAFDNQSITGKSDLTYYNYAGIYNISFYIALSHASNDYDIVLYSDSYVVSQLNFNYQSTSSLNIFNKTTYITNVYPVNLNQFYLINVIFDFSNSEYTYDLIINNILIVENYVCKINQIPNIVYFSTTNTHYNYYFYIDSLCINSNYEINENNEFSIQNVNDNGYNRDVLQIENSSLIGLKLNDYSYEKNISINTVMNVSDNTLLEVELYNVDFKEQGNLVHFELDSKNDYMLVDYQNVSIFDNSGGLNENISFNFNSSQNMDVYFTLYESSVLEYGKITFDSDYALMFYTRPTLVSEWVEVGGAFPIELNLNEDYQTITFVGNTTSSEPFFIYYNDLEILSYGTDTNITQIYIEMNNRIFTFDSNFVDLELNVNYDVVEFIVNNVSFVVQNPLNDSSTYLDFNFYSYGINYVLGFDSNCKMYYNGTIKTLMVDVLYSKSIQDFINYEQFGYNSFDYYELYWENYDYTSQNWEFSKDYTYMNTSNQFKANALVNCANYPYSNSDAPIQDRFILKDENFVDYTNFSLDLYFTFANNCRFVIDFGVYLYELKIVDNHIICNFYDDYNENSTQLFDVSNSTNMGNEIVYFSLFWYKNTTDGYYPLDDSYRYTNYAIAFNNLCQIGSIFTSYSLSNFMPFEIPIITFQDYIDTNEVEQDFNILSMQCFDNIDRFIEFYPSIKTTNQSGNIYDYDWYLPKEINFLNAININTEKEFTYSVSSVFQDYLDENDLRITRIEGSLVAFNTTHNYDSTKLTLYNGTHTFTGSNSSITYNNLTISGNIPTIESVSLDYNFSGLTTYQYFWDYQQSNDFILEIDSTIGCVDFGGIEDYTIIYYFYITYEIFIIEIGYSILDVGINSIAPILLMSIFPFVFFKIFGKKGIALGLVSGFVILGMSNYITLLQTIVLSVFSFCLGILIYKKEKQMEGL